MKKITLSIIISLMLIPLANAATIFSDYANTFGQNTVRELAPVEITAQSDNEITSEHGINLLIDPDRYILWNASVVSVSGSAVDNGRVSASLTPIYTDGYKVLHIPVQSNWLEGEQIQLTGLSLRSYDREVSHRFMGLDLTGDKIADVQDVNSYRVNTDVHTDQTIPYPVENLSYTVSENENTVTLTWNNPPDYDIVSITVEKQLTRNGIAEPKIDLFANLFTTQVVDNADVQKGDEIVYTVYAHDRRNRGEATDISVVVIAPVPEEEPEEPEEPSEDPISDEHEVTQEEMDSMNRLYISYKVRHEIKCLSDYAIQAGQRDDSGCLWAKINLVYTQEILELSDVDTNISDRDLYLLGLRIKWPEQRFQDKCVETDTPDKTCTALGRSLKRAHYFLEQQ